MLPVQSQVSRLMLPAQSQVSRLMLPAFSQIIKQMLANNDCAVNYSVSNGQFWCLGLKISENGHWAASEIKSIIETE